MRGGLKEEAIEQSINEIVRRHESLRTRFVTEEGEPVQVIDEAGAVKVPVIDISELGETSKGGGGKEAEREEAGRGFDLSEGPLLRVKVIRGGAEHHVVLMTMHHIISDGWSMGVLVREVASCMRHTAKGGRRSLSRCRYSTRTTRRGRGTGCRVRCLSRR